MLIKPNVSQSKTVTKRNLRDGIMLAIRNLNDLKVYTKPFSTFSQYGKDVP